MNITIVKPDNLTIIDNTALKFDLTPFTPENLHALQWKESSGHLEFTDKDNELIKKLPEWSKIIIEEHHRLCKEQHKTQEKKERQDIFINNGNTRQQRIERDKNTRLMQQQKKINHALEQM